MMPYLRRYLYKLLYDATLYDAALHATRLASTLKQLSISKQLINRFENDIHKYNCVPAEYTEQLKFLKALWAVRFKHWKTQD